MTARVPTTPYQHTFSRPACTLHPTREDWSPLSLAGRASGPIWTPRVEARRTGERRPLTCPTPAPKIAPAATMIGQTLGHYRIAEQMAPGVW